MPRAPLRFAAATSPGGGSHPAPLAPHSRPSQAPPAPLTRSSLALLRAPPMTLAPALSRMPPASAVPFLALPTSSVPLLIVYVDSRVPPQPFSQPQRRWNASGRHWPSQGKPRARPVLVVLVYHSSLPAPTLTSRIDWPRPPDTYDANVCFKCF